ncbi:hypothetical protein BAG01nite_20830 [Brevibacillus agri]|uniref:Uncharacterized protein n=1 Tax=Brevibacillus agri TaxID=51101 RepID=A0A3M8B9A1_9BACL|nr:hypothetical protein [Brevibacillus agri]ELK42695.1 hypothetical protein D478_07493 [Brevibacillus agri BAB-2500]MED3500778.1 hypothetical protein [Brevibacillus agri]QAV14974.1 hypothetical protein BA6348_20720 [Brevibacillus agri]RNB59950.1 hypothetical protein EB820_04005 [Brevibacillus agri]GED25981.1 hypothetical protein BAG01nite_20830 [Brevibacillus agri]
MDKLTIEPGVGIGTIKLGMSKEEVAKCIKEYNQKYNEEHFVNNYFQAVFRVKYDSNGKVNWIEIPSSVQEVFDCVFMDIDVFRTKAIDLVEEIDKITKYDRNYIELGYAYHFPEIGLLFWRPIVLTEEDLEKEWFKELDPEIQQDEMRNLFFETVTVFKGDINSFM